MKTGHFAGLVLGMVLLGLPVHATDPLSAREAMARAQLEAQRKGSTNLLERVERPGKRGFAPAETYPAPSNPELETRSAPNVQNAAPSARQ